MKIKETLARYGLRPNKNLGQNFLCNKNNIDAVISALELDGDTTVLEVGPGLGSLTVPLAERAGRVHAVEYDSKLAAFLREEFMGIGLSHKVTIHQTDFLKFDMSFLSCVSNLKIVGSLPYYITSPCIRRVFDEPIQPSQALFIIQREVAEKLVARPGSPNYTVLALEAEYYGTVCTVSNLPPDSFYPNPTVHSRAVIIKRHETPVVSSEKNDLFRVINAAFSMRRKTLQNCLAMNFPQLTSGEIVNAIAATNHPPNVRGEALSLQEFDVLTQKITEKS